MGRPIFWILWLLATGHPRASVHVIGYADELPRLPAKLTTPTSIGIRTMETDSLYHTYCQAPDMFLLYLPQQHPYRLNLAGQYAQWMRTRQFASNLQSQYLATNPFATFVKPSHYMEYLGERELGKQVKPPNLVKEFDDSRTEYTLLSPQDPNLLKALHVPSVREGVTIITPDQPMELLNALELTENTASFLWFLEGHRLQKVDFTNLEATNGQVDFAGIVMSK